MAVHITSPHNPRIKAAAALRQGRQRRREGRMLIDGVREIGRALQARVVPVEVFYCPDLCRSDEARRLLERSEEAGAEMLSVAEPVFRKLAFGDRAEGVAAVALTPRPVLADLALPQGALVAVLEGIEKPGNVGAVLRSADAAGLAAVILADGKTDLYNPNAIRASLGTIFTVPVAEATAAETLEWLNDGGFRVFAARVEGASLYTEADYTGRSAIVLGGEAEGLTGLWLPPAAQPVRVPMLGAADSLNVSVTAAVIFFEAIRQRRP